MIGETSDLYIICVNAHNPLHHADRHIGAIQRAALLDVKLQVATECAGEKARFGQPRRVTTKFAHIIGQRDSVAYPSKSPGRSTPAAAPLPAKVFSSSVQITIWSGCRVVMPRSSNVCMTSIADIEPKSPSKLPPPGTESICEPKRMGLRF